MAHPRASGTYMTIDDVRYLLRSQQKPRNRAIHDLIMLIEKRIRNAVTAGGMDVLIVLPPFQCDVPHYDSRQLMEKLHRHFEEKGFYVKPVNDITIYISWNFTN